MPNLKHNVQTPFILCLLGFYAIFLCFLIYLSFVWFLLVKMAFCMSFFVSHETFPVLFLFSFLSLLFCLGILFGSFYFWWCFNFLFWCNFIVCFCSSRFYILSTVKFFSLLPSHLSVFTSQYPVLLAPIRTIYPFSFKNLIFFSTAVNPIPTIIDSCVCVTFGLLLISSKICLRLGLKTL